MNLAYITDDSTRRVTFKKRNKGLFKKLSELTTLCDIKVCAVVYNPDEGRPMLFPDDPLDVFNIISDFRKLSVTEQKRKMFDQEDYLNERIAQTKEQLSRLRMDNQERRLTQLMYEFLLDRTKTFDNMSISDLREFNKLIERHLREIEQHTHTLGEGMAALSLPSNHPLVVGAPEQIPARSEQIMAINPPIVGPMEPLPSHFIARENNIQGHANVANNSISMETNSMLLDQWFLETLRNSEDAGASNKMPFLGLDPNIGAM